MVHAITRSDKKGRNVPGGGAADLHQPIYLASLALNIPTRARRGKMGNHLQLRPWPELGCETTG